MPRRLDSSAVMQRAVRALPSPTVAVATALAAILIMAALVSGLFDPDYFWHLATGRLILATASIPTTDPFSFSWNGRPWIPDQWLGDLVIAWLIDNLGVGVALVTFGLIAGSAFIILAFALQARVSTSAFICAAVLPGLVCLPFVTVRPQVLSWSLLAAVLGLLITAGVGAERRLVLLPPLFLLWANLHGLYVVGLGIGFVYLVATLLGRTPMAHARVVVLVVALASLFAVMITPSGPAGMLYSLSFADATDWGARNIAEWQSPNFHDPVTLPLLMLIAGLIVNGARGAPGWVTTVSLVGVVLGLSAVRNAPVAAILALPALALGIEDRLRRRWPSTRIADSRIRARRYVDIAFALIVAVVAIGVGVAHARTSDQPAADRFPVASVEILRNRLPAVRVLASYGWGGYVLEELYPAGGRVFVDGRMHKYASDVIGDYQAIVDAEPGWQERIRRYDVRALLLTPSMTLARGPAQAAGWCEVYRDSVQVLLLRACDGA